MLIRNIRSVYVKTQYEIGNTLKYKVKMIATIAGNILSTYNIHKFCLNFMYICVMLICNINVMSVMICHVERRYRLNYISLEN